MWPFILKNIIGAGIPFAMNLVGTAINGRKPTIPVKSKTVVFASTTAWLGVVMQMVVSLNALPGLESLIGKQGGTIIAILGILIRAYREITTGPIR